MRFPECFCSNLTERPSKNNARQYLRFGQQRRIKWWTLHHCVLYIVVLHLLQCSGASRSIPLMSNCTYSYGTDFAAVVPHSKTPKSMFAFEPLAEPSLKVINFGFGTTATNGVYYRDLKEYGSGCHWTHCSGGWTNYLVEHIQRVRHCAQQPDRTVGGPCDTALWVSQLKEVLPKMLSKGPRLLGDSPMNVVFNEVLALVPDVIVQHTLRNPMEWVLRRIDAHGMGDGDDLLCDPNKMPSDNPFDILPCIRNSSFVMDNLVFMKAFIGISQQDAHRLFVEGSNSKSNGGSAGSGMKEKPSLQVQQRVRIVAHYFALFNRHVLEHTKEENYFPSCLWDTVPPYSTAIGHPQLQQQQHHHHHVNHRHSKWKPKPKPPQQSPGR